MQIKQNSANNTKMQMEENEKGSCSVVWTFKNQKHWIGCLYLIDNQSVVLWLLYIALFHKGDEYFFSQFDDKKQYPLSYSYL